MASTLRPIVVALYFAAVDVPRLWDMAARHYGHDDEFDISMFAKAARATERGLPIVLECTYPWQLEEAKAFFIRNGVQAPRIEELRP